MNTSTPRLGCHCPARTGHWVIGLLEAWLRQASDGVLDELAEFAYGPEPDLGRVDELIELIRRLTAELRPAPSHPAPREHQ